MSGNLRVIADLQTEIEAEGFRGIDKQSLLDTLQSLEKVAGTLSIDDGVGIPHTVVAGWGTMEIFDTGTTTQGVINGLTVAGESGSYLKIGNDAAGDYTVNCSIRVISDTDGIFRYRVGGARANGDPWNSPFLDAIEVTAGITASIQISGGICKGMETGDTVALQVIGVNGAVLTVPYGQFGMVR
jgi:hypothetical protein